MENECIILDNSSSVFGITEFCVAPQEFIEELKGSKSSGSFSFPVPIICIFCLIIGVASNGLVLAIIATDSSFRTLTNAILASFSSAAVIFLILSVPVVVGRQSHNSWNGSRWLCIFSNYFEFFANANFVWHLVIVAAQIYIVVIHPLKARMIITKTRGTIMILSTWAFAAILGIIAAVSSALNRTLYSTSMSMSDVLWSVNNCIVRLPLPARWNAHGIQLYFLVHCILLFAVPFIILTYIYTCVIKKLWFSTKQFQQSAGSVSRTQRLSDTGGRAKGSKDESSDRLTPNILPHSDEGKFRTASIMQQHKREVRNPTVEKRKQIIIMLLVVMLVFFLGWLPKSAFSIFILHKFGQLGGDSVIVILMALFQNLPFVQCCLNPFIYVFVSKNWRVGLSKLLHRALPCLDCRRPQPDQAYNAICMQTMDVVHSCNFEPK